MRKIFSLVVLFLLSSVLTGKAQELRCNVQLVTQQIQGSNKQIFRTFQTAIYEFMNNRNWTQDVFDASEKIECNILINLTEQIGGDQFRGTIQVQSRRPVYNSTYSTTVLNFMDNNFDVRYVENETLEFDDNQHLSNLTSILAYYAYTIIGLDYDTFSPEGGTFYLKKAETIVMNAQNAPEGGWKAFGSSGNRNRYWLTQNLLDNNYQPVRKFYYQYHRLGMDQLVTNVNTGRTQIEESLKLLQSVYRNKPDPYVFLLQVVFDAKADEFVEIFKDAFPDQKRRAYLILKEINPSNTKLYDEINQTGE
jgi:hypothetical protein